MHGAVRRHRKKKKKPQGRGIAAEVEKGIFQATTASFKLFERRGKGQFNDKKAKVPGKPIDHQGEKQRNCDGGGKSTLDKCEQRGAHCLGVRNPVRGFSTVRKQGTKGESCTQLFRMEQKKGVYFEFFKRIRRELREGEGGGEKPSTHKTIVL